MHPHSPEASNDFFDNAPCGCVLLALDGAILRVNDNFLAIVGLSTQKATAMRFQQVLSRAGAIYYETGFAPTLRLRGTLKEVALDLLNADRQRIPVLISANLQHDSAGTPIAIRLAIFEATERRSYEAELLQSRNRAERMVEVIQHTTDAVVFLNPHGVIQSWNNGAEQMFGYAQGEVLGQALWDVLFPTQTDDDLHHALSLLHQGQDVSSDVPARTKAGAQIQLSMNLAPHLEAPGTFVGFSAIIRDITARKQTEKALLQSEKLASVGRLASSIAHEINNPLESITNLLYILDGMTTDPEMKGFVNTAQDEVARVSQIATHTLRFHRQSTRKTALDLHELFDSTLALYRARLTNSSITATVDRTVSRPLLCFEGELRQILANLVGNAFDAMRTGGRLLLRTRESTHWPTGEPAVRLTVADTGSGMNAHVLAHLFEPFFSTKGIGGTGLGLWITQELVEKNGGTIQVRSSDRPGRSGTTFSILFRQ